MVFQDAVRNPFTDELYKAQIDADATDDNVHAQVDSEHSGAYFYEPLHTASQGFVADR